MPDRPEHIRRVAASREAEAWPAEPGQWRCTQAERRGDWRLAAFLFAVSWFALVGLIATLAWAWDGVAMLLRAAGA